MKKNIARSLRVIELKSSDSKYKPFLENYLKRNNFDKSQIDKCFELQSCVFAKSYSSKKVEGLIFYSPQEWEKKILKKNVIRIIHILVDSGNYRRKHKIATLLLKKLLWSCKKNKIQCIVTRIEEERIPVIHALEGTGFNIIESFLTFKNDTFYVPQATDKIQVVLYKDSYIKYLKDIARLSFKYSRFHADPMISDRVAGLSRAEWIENACHGRADRVLVAKSRNQVVGFVACRSYTDKEGNKTGIIDLMATHHELKGQGVGTCLLKSALEYFLKQGCRDVIVGTQAKNIPSINLYIKCGFKLWKSQLTFINYLN
ncbi:MAG: GNAT family N-acetyltransferase [Candidatus Aminicenantaceae bacterium]